MRIFHIAMALLFCIINAYSQTVPTHYCQELVDLANKSNVEAQTNLGICYLEGLGVEEDWIKAAELFTLAADKGYAEAQCRLGECYINRQGVRRNAAKGFELFKQAADQGYGKGEYLVGTCYFDATSVNLDFEEAAKWAKKAINHGYSQAHDLLAACGEYSGEDVKSNLLAGAESGDAAAQFDLGMWYLDEYTGERDINEATKWLLKAAEQNCVGAYLQLGHIYYGAYGEENGKDYEKAMYWYQKGKENGDWIAERCLNDLIADMYIYEIERDLNDEVEDEIERRLGGELQIKHNN